EDRPLELLGIDRPPDEDARLVGMAPVDDAARGARRRVVPIGRALNEELLLDASPSRQAVVRGEERLVARGTARARGARGGLGPGRSARAVVASVPSVSAPSAAIRAAGRRRHAGARVEATLLILCLLGGTRLRVADPAKTASAARGARQGCLRRWRDGVLVYS